MIACPSDIRAAIRVYYLGEAAAVPAPAESSPQGAVIAPAPPTPKVKPGGPHFRTQGGPAAARACP